MSSESERVIRGISPELDDLLGRRLGVLDEGFVRVIDYMGGDAAIVQAARVSYGDGTKKYHEDRGLIRYLMRHRHTTPFEMCEIKLHVRVPMDCWRQWIRHRTASVNEYSTRYSVAIDAMQRTTSDAWRSQATLNRQGSSGGNLSEDVGRQLSIREKELQIMAREIYEERLAADVAREQARKDLPLSTYTEAYWKIDLHNLLHFLALRLDSHAQFEIRKYAEVIGYRIVATWCPISWEAFLDYGFNQMQLSSKDQEVIRAIISSKEEGEKAALAAGFLTSAGEAPPRSRELAEFEAKLTALGLVPPWRS